MTARAGAVVYLQVSSEICADDPDQPEDCHSPGTNDGGEREGLLLPWRLMVTGSFAL